MIAKKTDDNLIPCPWRGKCIHRTEFGGCLALSDVSFSDGVCHFRKKEVGGPFVVDVLREKLARIEGKGAQ